MKSQIADTFITSFVHELIKSSNPEGYKQGEEEARIEIAKRNVHKKIPEEIRNKSFSQNLSKNSPLDEQMQPSIVPSNSEALTKELSPVHPAQPKFSPTMQRSIKLPPMSSPIHNPPKIPPPQQNKPDFKPFQEGELDLGPLGKILKDPRVQAIEVPGQSKPVLVRKDGTKMRTDIRMRKEEIENIIKSFSKNSRVPIIGGIFKAAIDNLLMTAVTSEFAEGRFIIEKRNPFQQLPIPRR